MMNVIVPTPDHGKAMAAAGLKAVFNILEQWHCSADQAQAILNISKAAYYKYRRAPDKATLNSDQLERLSYLLNIHAHLRVLFDNPDNVYGFMRMPNQHPFFNGKAPLEIIATGKFAALYETFKHIDAIRGGQW